MAARGEVWLVDFGDPFPGEPAHHRPAVVLGPPEVFGPRFPFVILIPTTTTARGLSLHVELEPGEGTGLAEVRYAQCELLRSVNRRRLVHRLGAAHPVALARIDQVVRTLLSH